MRVEDVDKGGFCAGLGVEFTLEGPDRTEGTMPLGPEKWQPWGFVHGGATISFLESLASRASEFRHDMSTEAAFGVDVHVRHRKPAKNGLMTGYAQFVKEEPSSNGIGRKQYWEVAAFDEEGDVISSGTIMTKVVPKERLAQKDQERAAARSAQDGAVASADQGDVAAQGGVAAQGSGNCATAEAAQ